MIALPTLRQQRLLFMPDRGLLLAVSALIFIGLVMVASASVAEVPADSLIYFKKQLVYAVLSFIGAVVIIHIPMALWQRHAFLLLGLGLFILMLVLLPGMGHEVNGSKRWFMLGPLSIQASEPARFCLLMYVASYASRRQVGLNETWGGLYKPMFLIMVASGLLLLEPDFGATAVLVVIASMVLFMAGVRLIPLVSLTILGGIILSLLAVLSPYRAQRLASFTNPWADPLDSGFQLVQALIAIGRGQWAGVGLGNSIQKLAYLPETHTDFLFAVYAEEFGLLGVLVLLGLFLVVVWRAFKIARRAVVQGQLFSGFVAYGFASWLVLQAFINIGVNMGVLPTKGLTLPLLSYGGSSLVVTCAVIAVLVRIDLESRKQQGASHDK